MRLQLLEAREARQALIDRACAALRPAGGGGAVVFASTGVPGAAKTPAGLEQVFAAACGQLRSRLEAVPAGRGVDALGPWAIFTTPRPPADAKRVAVEIESAHPSGRLLDLDVYDGGRQLGRASLGLPPRACLVCDRPAVECIRLKRHDQAELPRAVERLLEQVRRRSASGGSEPRAASARLAASLSPRTAERLAASLVTGARIELALTPKPGLVDRDDNGSHPDLSFHLMSQSIDLLPAYFDELLALGLPTGESSGRAPGPLPAAGSSVGGRLPAATLAACVGAGRRAEKRMQEVIGSNAHRGYIFLGGLVLLGSLEGGDDLRPGIGSVARAAAGARNAGAGGPPSHGAVARDRHALGGIEREALEGLPSVFEHGLPAFRARRAAHDGRRGADTDESLHYAMAVLMQVVEDTTAVHRCGPDGLQRLRDDGRRLQGLIDSGQPYLPWLRDLNTTYRRMNLTMGGVADCLALTVALDRWRS